MDPPTQNAAFGVDVGGTHTRVALVEAITGIREQRRWPTAETPTPERLAERICGAIQGLTEESGEPLPGAPVGLAVPGTLDGLRQRVVRCVNLPFLQNEAVGQVLERSTGRCVALCTDAEAATWGEYAVREAAPVAAIAAPTLPRFVHLRIGTGIACGTVLDGALVRLDQDRQTHLPFLVVDDTSMALECRCGLRGCLETIASGAALAIAARGIGLDGGLHDLEAAWRRAERSGSDSNSGCEKGFSHQPTRAAVELVDRAARAVALAIGQVVRHFQADEVCLGGGVATRLPGLIDQAIVHFREREASGNEGTTLVVRARLGDDAGVIGAAGLARD